MEQDHLQLNNFENLNPTEKRFYLDSLARVFSRRVIVEEKTSFFPNLKDEVIRINEGIPEDFTLPNTGPKYGVSPITWIPCAKYKILIKNGFILSDTEQRVWFEIIFDKTIEKDQKDVMKSVIQDPKSVVLSCLVIPEYNNFKIGFHFYVLRDDNGWKKIKDYYYYGFKNSHMDNQDSGNTGLIGFDDLSSPEKGLLGESLGHIFARRLLIENKTHFFPLFEKEVIRIEKLRYYTVSQSWEPDISFQILTNVDPIDLTLELIPKKHVCVEVKTGRNARFERFQKDDMQNSSLKSNLIILCCNILPDSSNSKLNVLFQQVQYKSAWATVGQYYYKDFL
ncbi:MAG: hypothetical protein WB811_01675 [Methanoregula sp.]|uniref:hypothetical protein n=1 Tax=Methanoregula sp. TaxID=2052170 RepID=UPI003BAE5515